MQTIEVTSTKNVYAIGDTCLQVTDSNFPYGHPQLAQVAIQQGKNLAENLIAMADNKTQNPFHYNDRGTMAIIGRNYGVVDLTFKRIHVSGFIGLLVWLFVHLTSLINFQNKIKTLYNWIVAYLTRDLHLRMIVRPFKKPQLNNSVNEKHAQLTNGKVFS